MADGSVTARRISRLWRCCRQEGERGREAARVRERERKAVDERERSIVRERERERGGQ